MVELARDKMRPDNEYPLKEVALSVSPIRPIGYLLVAGTGNVPLARNHSCKLITLWKLDEMPQTNSNGCELGELTLRELAGLHILNETLKEAERWIREQSVCEQYKSESDSNTATSPHNPPASALPKELTLTASVVCMSVTADPCNAAAHSQVSRLKATGVVGQSNARADPKKIALAGESLFGLQPCALFRTLIAELGGDWLQILAVRILKVELTASASREFEVATASLRRCPSAQHYQQGTASTRQ